MPEPLLEALEADLRALAVEARKNDGVAAHITGWFSGPEHPQIKEAAERTMLRLRSISAKDDGLDHAKTSKVRALFFALWVQHGNLANLCRAPWYFPSPVRTTGVMNFSKAQPQRELLPMSVSYCRWAVCRRR